MNEVLAPAPYLGFLLPVIHIRSSLLFIENKKRS